MWLRNFKKSNDKAVFIATGPWKTKKWLTMFCILNHENTNKIKKKFFIMRDS